MKNAKYERLRMTKNKRWPENEDELIEIMKKPDFLNYCEDRGIFIRFDDNNHKVIITKIDKSQNEL